MNLGYQINHNHGPITITGRGDQILQMAPVIPNVSYKIMPSSSRQFTGRRKYLDRLKAFFASMPDEPAQRRHFLLHGLGGAGKSQLCIKFVEEARDR